MEVKVKCEFEKTEGGADMHWVLTQIPTKPSTPHSPLLRVFHLVVASGCWVCTHSLDSGKSMILCKG